MFKNPHLDKPREWLDDELKLKGLPEDDPTVQRNYFGRWVRDEKAQLFQYLPGRNDFENKVFAFISSDIEMAKPFMTPPNTPADRVAALRTAFDKTMTDPDFRADALKAKVEVSPIDGAALEALVRQTIETPPDIVATAKRWMTRN
jgi:hypothetical protein